VEPAFKGVEVCEGENLFVLEPSDNDSGRDLQLSGEALNGLCAEPALLTKRVQSVLRNEKVRGKGVRLLLFAEGFVILRAIRRFDENIAFTVFQDVGSLVEKSKPEEVFPLAAKAQLENGFGRGEPASGTVSESPGKLR